MRREKIYDCLIIGGGPAGLSSAIYLARFLRSCVIIDKGFGRTEYAEINENYMGFPEGIPAHELRELGVKQAKKFGADYRTDDVVSLKKSQDLFQAMGKNEKYTGRTVILATGVTDIFPEFTEWRKYVGKSLFWCITCDGYITRGKKVMVVGRKNEAAITCLQFLTYTHDLIFVFNCTREECEISEKRLYNLEKNNIPIFPGHISSVRGENGYMNEVTLDTGVVLATDYMFNLQGARPNIQLAEHLGVTISKKGYIEVGDEQRTNISGVYAAGDVTGHFSHQIASAVHEGSMAAQAVNYDMYLPEQKAD